LAIALDQAVRADIPAQAKAYAIGDVSRQRSFAVQRCVSAARKAIGAFRRPCALRARGIQCIHEHSR
jgi:hypothetical protein